MKYFCNLIGRWGNLLFQYCHARAFCEQNGYTLCIPPWVGEQVFDIPHADRTPAHQCNMTVEDTCQRQECLIYTRRQVKEWLRIKPSVLEMLRPVLDNRKPVLLDWRHGDDYIGAGLVSLGPKCYSDAMKSKGYTVEDCEWEIDTSPTRLPAFQGDVTAAGLGTTWVSLPAFYRMMTAQVHFRANSTFSFWAATLGNATIYAPVIKGIKGGKPDAYAPFVEGNWPVMANNAPNTDLHLPE